jgi:hypothetical protein
MRALILGVVLSIAACEAAFPQTGKHVAVGGGFVINEYADGSFNEDQPRPSFVYRIRLKPDSRHGWHWTPSGAFDWFRPDVTTNVVGQSTRLGELRARPVMAGIAREYSQGPLNLGVSLIAGPSFNAFSVDDAARTAYRTRLGTELNGVSVKTSLAVRPGGGVWYDLGRWIAVGGSVDYMINRITTETTIGGVESSKKWKTDHLGFHFGIVVGIF